MESNILVILLILLILFGFSVWLSYKSLRVQKLDRVWVVKGYLDEGVFQIVAVCRSHEKAVEIKKRVDPQYAEVWVGWRHLE